MQATSLLTAQPNIEEIDRERFVEHEASIRRFYASSFANEPWNEIITESSMDALFQKALDPSSLFLGAFNANGVCVAVAIGLSVGQESPAMPPKFTRLEKPFYLSDICCDPGHQRGGVGSLLLATFEQRCAEIGHLSIVLRTLGSCEWLCDFYGNNAYSAKGAYDCPINRVVGRAVKEEGCIRVVFSKSIFAHQHRG